MIIKEQLTGKYKHIESDLGLILHVEVMSYEVKEDGTTSIPVYFYKKAKLKDEIGLKKLGVLE